ncbi:M48 family metalloprotease [Falsiroseomonas oryziterrae]|uniref:M48 family metalloprotease n=1 Tax=Falsiroseomonas oryziterrae TaxID=2911368 RepID=UPI001F0129A1|nr:M48 family metalloprotease [Roseomonas sp. NPKOSM-4]
MLPATGLRTHAWNTAIRSVLLLAGFPVLLTLMGYAIALFIVSGQVRTVEQGLVEAARLLPVIVPAALALACVWFAIAFLAHNRILDAITGAKRVTDPRQEPRFWKLTEELCISRGMALPRLAVIETPQRNAFASGLTRETAGVTVTRGLMDALDDRELRAVIAHELAHIRNGDARLGVIAAVFVGVITLVTDRVWNILRFARFRVGSGRSSRSSSRGSNSGGGGAMLVLILIGILIAIIAHVLALVLRMALSRNREYLADAGAVELTGDPDAMIGALRKVEQRAAMPDIPEQVRALFLHDAALSGAVGWFATHPPIDKRVETLVRFAGGHDPGPLPALTAAATEAEALWPTEAGAALANSSPAPLGTAAPAGPPASSGASTGSPWGDARSAVASGPWGPRPEPAPEPPAPLALPPRAPMQERLDAMAAFARTNNAVYMDNLAKRTAARRAGLDPDAAAPPPPRRN